MSNKFKKTLSNINRSVEEIKKITQELIENKLALLKGETLFRYHQIDQEIVGTLRNEEELFDLAYHVIINGKLMKEGSFKLQDNEPFISLEDLIRTNEVHLFSDGKGRNYTENYILPAYTKFLRAYVDYWGWFYPEQTETLEKSIKDLNLIPVAEEFVSNSLYGSKFLKSFSKSFWNIDNGPVQSFYDDKKLKAVLKYRFGLNNSKNYQYELSDGTKVSCKETFDISFKNVRFGFIVQRNSVSWFRPGTAVSIYKKFLKGIDKPVVWDPSIGFSARLLAFASCFPNGKYIGTDPAEIMIYDAYELSNKLKNKFQNFSVDLQNKGSEFVKIEENSVDFVFTSPPYFDKEKYVSSPGQCWKEYPSLSEWREKYLLITFQNAFKALKNEKFMLININNELATSIIEIAEKAGFVRTPEFDLKLPLSADHFLKKMDHSIRKSEPILAFQKINQFN